MHDLTVPPSADALPESPTRCAAPPAINRRLWLYANFDCNLACDYCCVRSSPRAKRKALGLDRIRSLAAEAGALGVQEIFVTGGEPFLLTDVAEIITACAATAPTTVLTNGMLFSGRRLQALRSLAGRGVTLQISLDSPTPDRHDAHRGKGTWARAWAGVQTARAEGFRVRIAATVSTDDEDSAIRHFFDDREVRCEDRVVRRIALRGAAQAGVPLGRRDLFPEVTITADGVYWHPVGAGDADFLVQREILPLADAYAAVRQALRAEPCFETRQAQTFKCA